MSRLSLLNGFNSGSSLQFNANESLNLHLVDVGADSGKGRYKLRTGFGLNSVLEIDVPSSLAGVHVVAPNSSSSKQRVFIVTTGEIYEYFENNTVTIRHTFSGSFPFGSLRMADNGRVISLVSGLNSWFYDLSTNVTSLITDPDYPSLVIDVVFLDTYFIWLTSIADESRIYVSDNFATDPANCINALDFTVAESSPDNTVLLAVYNNELVVFGTYSIEFYFNSGNPNFPFERNSGVTQNIGCQYSGTIQKINNRIYFWGYDPEAGQDIYVLSGYELAPLKNQSINRDIDNYIKSGNTEIYSYSLQEESTTFYTINLGMTSQLTYLLDVNTGIWHKRKFENSATFTNGSYGSRYKVNAFGETFFIKRETWQIYAAIFILKHDKTKYTIDTVNASNGDRVSVSPERLFVSDHIYSENKNIIINKFEMDIQKGVGNVEDTDPEITLSVSRDGGMTYGSSRIIKMGALGDFKARVLSRRLGVSRDFVLKISSTSPVQHEWFNAYIDYEVLDE